MRNRIAAVGRSDPGGRKPGRERQPHVCQPVGVGGREKRMVVRGRGPRPHGSAARTQAVRARRIRCVPGAHAVPRGHGADFSRTRRCPGHLGAEDLRPRTRGAHPHQGQLRAQRLRIGARGARPHRCGAAHGHGGPGQARLQARHGRDQRGVARARAEGHAHHGPERLQRPGKGQGHGSGGDGRRQGAAGRKRGGARRRGRGAARTHGQQELGPAARPDGTARLRSADRYGPDAGGGQAALRDQGAAPGGRRRPSGHARAAGHAPSVESPAAPERARRSRDRGAAQRRHHLLPHRCRGDRRDRPLRDGRCVDPVHPGPDGVLRSAAAGAGGRPLPRRRHRAQHLAAASGGGRFRPRCRHIPGAGAPDGIPGSRRGARAFLGCDGTLRRGGGGLGDRRGGQRDGRPGPLAGRAARRAGRAAAGVSGEPEPAGGAACARRRAAGRCAGRRRRARERPGEPRRRAECCCRRHAALPLRVHGTEDFSGGGAAGSGPVGALGGPDSFLHGRRRPGEVLPVHHARGPGADRLHPRHQPGGRLDAARGPAPAGGPGPQALRGRQPRSVFAPAHGRPRHPQARRAGSPLALRRGRTQAARFDRRRPEPVADLGRDRLGGDPAQHAGPAQPRGTAGPGRAGAPSAADVPGDGDGLFHRGLGPPVVADGLKRCQCRAPGPDGTAAGRLAGGHAQARAGRPGAAAGRVLGSYDRQCLGSSRHGAVLAEVRNRAGHRHDPRGPRRPKPGYRLGRQPQGRCRAPGLAG